MEEKIERPKANAHDKKTKLNGTRKTAVTIDDEEEDEDDEDIPMSDLEDLDDEEREDLIPHQRKTIDNKAALTTSLNRIRIPTDASVAFSTHQSVVGAEATAEGIPDVSDDLTRELQFYKQSLEAARKARSLLTKEGVPFSRPNDYFAEMGKELASPHHRSAVGYT